MILGPSLFGHLWPGASLSLFGATASAPITMISQIGLVLLMFQIGMDFEFGHLARPRNRNATIGVAAASISIPFVLGFAIGEYSAPYLAPRIDSLAYSLFLGVGCAITALPTLRRILREYALTRIDDDGSVAARAAAEGGLCDSGRARGLKRPL